jgi:hypothetical protein
MGTRKSRYDDCILDLQVLRFLRPYLCPSVGNSGITCPALSLPETFPTNEKADLAISTNTLTALETITGPASSIGLNSLPDADTQPKRLDQTCPLMTCTHLVSIVEPTDGTLSPNASGHTLEVSQQTLLDALDQTTLTHYPASHDSTSSPSITSQAKYRPVSKET